MPLLQHLLAVAPLVLPVVRRYSRSATAGGTRLVQAHAYSTVRTYYGKVTLDIVRLLSLMVSCIAKAERPIARHIDMTKALEDMAVRQ